MLHLVVGRQGSGKTLFLVKIAYDDYKKGKTIYSNVHLKFPYKKLNYNDIINCKLQNATVIIDEIHILLPSRNSMQVRSRKICDGFISMIRKKNLEVYGTTQFERKVDIRIRDEKDFYYICSKWSFLNNKWGEILHNQNMSKKIPTMIKLNIIEMFSYAELETSFIANPYYNMYDTNQVIQIED